MLPCRRAAAPPLPCFSFHLHHSLTVTQHPCIHLSDTRRRPNQSIILPTPPSRLHEVQYARHLRLFYSYGLLTAEISQIFRGRREVVQVTHWIHSAIRRAGQPPRPLGAQHLAHCPSIRLISRSPFSCAHLVSQRLTASPLAC